MKKIVGLLVLLMSFFSANDMWGYYYNATKIKGVTYGKNSETGKWYAVSTYYEGYHDFISVAYSGEITIIDSIQDNAVMNPIVGLYIQTPMFFKDVTKLTVPNTLRNIVGINGCKIETIDLPDSLQNMPSFDGCPNLREVVIPQSIKVVNKYDLSNCPKLTHVHIGAGVSSIAPDAFIGSTALTTITVDEENKYFSVEDGVLFNKDKTKLIFFPKGRTGRYVVPDGVTGIESYAFHQCELTEVVVPESVKSLGEFTNSPNLERVVLPRNITRIGGFRGCTALKEVVMDGAEEIGYNAFKGCTGLKNIAFPEGITAVYDSAFAESGLVEITLPAQIESWGKALFMDCTELERVNLPDNLTTLKERMFNGCTSLKTIDIPASVTTIENYVFTDSGLETLTIPATVEKVGYFTNLLKELVISDSGRSIDFGRISYLFPLSYMERTYESIYVGREVSTIEESLFDARSLKEMGIGSNVKDISNLSFQHAIYLDTITCVGLTPPQAVEAQFPEAAYEYCTLYVPAMGEEDYRTTAPWSLFKNIKPMTNIVEPTAIELNFNSCAFSTYYSEIKQLIPQVIPSNASFSRVEWDSTNKRVATVSSDGVITPVGDGETDIIASVNNGAVSATCRVMVLYSDIDESVAEAITLYPNPVGDVLYVKGVPEGEAVILCNLSGQVVATASAEAGETAIDTADLPAGIYFCRIAGRTIKVVKR